MIRLARTRHNIAVLFLQLSKPFVMVIEHFVEDCGGCLSKAMFPGASFMYGTHERSRAIHSENPFDEPERQKTPEEDGTILLPESLKERMPALYSQEQERDPLVICKFFDPVGSWTWYATEGSPVDEDGYYGYPLKAGQLGVGHVR